MKIVSVIVVLLTCENCKALLMSGQCPEAPPTEDVQHLGERQLIFAVPDAMSMSTLFADHNFRLPPVTVTFDVKNDTRLLLVSRDQGGSVMHETHYLEFENGGESFNISSTCYIINGSHPEPEPCHRDEHPGSHIRIYSAGPLTLISKCDYVERSNYHYQTFLLLAGMSDTSEVNATFAALIKTVNMDHEDDLFFSIIMFNKHLNDNPLQLIEMDIRTDPPEDHKTLTTVCVVASVWLVIIGFCYRSYKRFPVHPLVE